MMSLRRREVYCDLSNHQFSNDEKTFAASEISGLTSQLQWPGGANCTNGLFSKRYNIPKSTLYNWKVILANQQAEFATIRGRPKVIDEVAEAAIVAALQERTENRDSMPLSSANDLINKLVTETRKRQGKRGAEMNNHTSPNTRRTIFKQLEIRVLAPQILTDARRKACECIRTSYIWGCLLLAYSGNLGPEYKWNADATTIIVGESLSGSLVCSINDGDNNTPVSSSTILDNLNILVKWFGLNNAAGESGPLVLVFAVSSMLEGSFFFAEIVGLASTSYIGKSGIIYFCKTGGGNPDMWKHYYLNVTIPTVKRSNAAHKRKVTPSTLFLSFISYNLTLLSCFITYIYIT